MDAKQMTEAPTTPSPQMRDRVLTHLRDCVPCIALRPVEVAPEGRIEVFLRDGGKLDDFDFLELHEAFGMRLGKEEWDQFVNRFMVPGTCGNARFTATWGDLADLYVAHLEKTCVRPLSVLGRPCPPAGAFRALSDVVAEVWPKRANIGPSTSLFATLRGHGIARLWRRLPWLGNGAVPGLRRTRLSRVVSAMDLASVLLLVVGFLGVLCFVSGSLVELCIGTARWLDACTLWAAIIAGTGTLGFAGVAVAHLVHRWDNCLPERIETFGDLAKTLCRSADAIANPR